MKPFLFELPPNPAVEAQRELTNRMLRDQQSPARPSLLSKAAGAGALAFMVAAFLYGCWAILYTAYQLLSGRCLV